MENNVSSDIDFLWSKPEIFIAKKRFNNELKPCIEKGFNWFVYYYYLNPKTKKLKKFKVTLGINQIKNFDKRTRAIKNLRKATERYLLEYNPFMLLKNNPYEISEENILINNLWRKPKIFIAMQNTDGKLCPDIKYDWYVFYYFLNTNTNKIKLFKVKESINKTLNINERVFAIKNLRDKLEQKLINGYNPFIKKNSHLLNNNEYAHYLKMLEEKNLLNGNSSSVFVDLKAEKTFHQILVNENVIDENNAPKHRFQTVVYNSFNLTNKIHDKIFKTKTLKTFVEFLEVKYHFEPSNKTKFGNKNHNLILKIIDFVEAQIKNESSQNPNKDEFYPN